MRGKRNIQIVSLLLWIGWLSVIQAFAQITNNPDSLNQLNRTNADSGVIRSVVVPGNGVNVPADLMPLEASFTIPEIVLNETDIVSNILRLNNRSNKPINFYVEVAYPYNWQLLLKVDKWYTIGPNDSMFIPVRIIPTHLFKGNIEYTINAFLFSEDGTQLANCGFEAHSKRISKWELNVGPRDKIYFKNKSNVAPFSVNVFNTGNEDQEIMMSFQEIGKGAMIQDSTEKNVSNSFYDFHLKPTGDTTFNFLFNYFDCERNYRRIDLEGHRPRSCLDERKYTLFIRTNDPDRANKTSYRAVKRINFYKLSDIKKVNPYSSATLPLIMDANAFNILGSQPMMNIMLRGNTTLENKASLIYLTQLNFTTYSFNTTQFLNNGYYLGYFYKRGDVQIGNVGAGTTAFGGAVSGKGINASYNITPKHKVGAFFVRRPFLFRPRTASIYGLAYRYTLSARNVFTGLYGHMDDPITHVNYDFGTLRAMFNPIKSHSFAVMFMGSRGVFNGANPKIGYLIGTNYSGRYFKNKLFENFRFLYRDNFMNYFGNSKNISMNNRLNYIFSPKWSAILINNYTYSTRPIYDFLSNTYSDANSMGLSNTLSFQRFISKGSLSSNAFYNFYENPSIRWQFRGLGLDYSYFDYSTNLRFANNLRAGYNHLTDRPQIRDFFSLQVSNLIQYRTISLIARYYYGPQTLTDTNILYGTVKYPQYFFSSVSYQYLFKDTRFLLQTNVNYSYFNQTYRHNFGIYPDFYFFTYNGWRFKLTVGYNINSNNPRKANYFNQFYSNPNKTGTESPSTQTAKITQNLNISLGIRKEFGIPIPKRWTKKHYTTLEVTAFLDANGNKRKDRDEILLENIVIGLGENWVQTNEDGRASFKNVEAGTYKYIVFQLEDLVGWFPNKPDSLVVSNQKELLVPFVRGVKIYGNVTVDREKYAAELSGTNLDVSRIRITALDTAGFSYTTLTNIRGDFELYVPLGNYTLSMDESILGDRFTLVKNNIKITLHEGTESIFNSFYIVEKKRKLSKKKFGADGKLIETPLGTGSGAGSGTGTQNLNRPGAPGTGAGTGTGTGMGTGINTGTQTRPGTGTGTTTAPGGTGSGAGTSEGAGKEGPFNKDGVSVKVDTEKMSKDDVNKLKKTFIDNTTKAQDLKGLVYTVQIGAFALPLNPRYFDPIKEALIVEQMENGMIRVSAGSFKTFEEAEVLRKQLVIVGFEDAHTVAYNDGKRISLTDAKKLETGK